MKRIDTSGYSCPEPVLMTKRALKSSGQGLEVIVDNVASRENVTRFAQATGYSVGCVSEGSRWILTLTK